MIKHTQNNLINENLVKRLVSFANFKKSDLVIEIGGGRGIITRELILNTENLICFEIDTNLYSSLAKEFKDNTNIKILNADFLDNKLPNSPFYIFSNIPFNITSQIMSRIYESKENLVSAYLVIQKEAIEKYAGEQFGSKNTMQSIIFGNYFTFELLYRFKRNDFYPIPNVDTYFVKIERRKEDIIDDISFIDFVAYLYNRSTPCIYNSKLFTPKQIDRFKKDIGVDRNTKPSEINLSSLLKMYAIVKITDKNILYKGYFNNILNQQEKIEKIHRTR